MVGKTFDRINPLTGAVASGAPAMTAAQLADVANKAPTAFPAWAALSQVIELEGWYTFAAGKDRGLGQFPQLSANDNGLQDILLDICGSCR